MSRKHHCPPGEHEFKKMRGTDRERCTKCAMEFPCLGRCQHVDCIEHTGNYVDLPRWITVRS